MTIIPIGYVSDESLYISAVQGVLDTVAQGKGYDGIVSACSYAGAPNPFQAESQAFVSWRGAVWEYCYLTLESVKNGEIAKPDMDDFINSLPQFGG